MATAAKLCCPVPRSESPDDEPPRPTRHFKSLAHIKSRISNGKHALAADDDINDENRPLYPADDLELQRIFVAASLPEDHPDAIRMTGRKPVVDESIVCSPSFTNKLRRQLSRKSLATSTNGMRIMKRPTIKPVKKSRSYGESLSAVFSAGYDHDAQSLNLTDEHYASLRRNDSVVTPETPGDRLHVDVGDTFLDGFELRSSIPDEPRRSVSVPITSSPTSPPHQLRRSRSSTSLPKDFGNMLVVNIPPHTFFDSDDMWPFTSSEPLASPRPSSPSTVQSPLLPPKKNSPAKKLLRSPTTSIPPLRSVRSKPSKGKSQHLNSPKVVQKGSTNSLHLYDMQISQHLRTRSQVSDDSMSSDLYKPLTDRYTHASLNSVVLSSVNPKHHRNVSSSGFASSTVPSAWGKVIEDESSSIYSRRPSSAFEVQQSPPFEVQPESPFIVPYEVSHDGLEAETQTETDSCSNNSVQENHAIPTQEQAPFQESVAVVPKEPPACLQDEANSRRAMAQQASDSDGPSEATSLPKSDSSGSLGKLSKFKEDLADSPSAKTSRKRRSVLRILFPKLTRLRARSISTPLLWEKTHDTVALYDGAGDTSELLSVQKTPSKQSTGGRSVGFNDLADAGPSNSAFGNTLAVPEASRSRQSMVDYEKTLSVVGDDRRRKSTFTGTAIPEVQLVDRKDSPERLLHRASPLVIPSKKGTENALMEKALQQHQLEKAALLRVNSKRSQTAAPPANAPIFKSPFGGPPTTSSRGVSPAMDELDPLDAQGSSGVRQSQSMQELRASTSLPNSYLPLDKKCSTTWTASTVSAEDYKGKDRGAISMVIWSQFPSHTRAKRCGSALRSDGVISRDFAYASEPGGVRGIELVDSETPSSSKRWSRLSDVKKKNWVVKSRSITFGTVIRYYSNLLTSSAARNRRSSTATGGRLEHPELEVLPPIMPAISYTNLPHHVHVKDQLERLVGPIKNESHHLKDEAHEIAAHHHRGRSPSPLQAKTSGSIHEAPVTQGKDASEGNASDTEDDDDDENIGPLDGAVEDKPADPPSARRLSRMYQACVRIPTSLNASKEFERMGSSEDAGLGINRSASPTILPGHGNTPKKGLLKVPSSKTRLSSGPVIRRFPSATVVDDRKGHWRSISLISVDSGKSVRRSTRDLLEFFKTTENEEREKLMGAMADETSMDHIASS